jgi:hypothetical protein
MAHILSFTGYCEHYELDPSSPDAQDQYDGYLYGMEAPE